jgi:hypothetical protein
VYNYPFLPRRSSFGSARPLCSPSSGSTSNGFESCSTDGGRRVWRTVGVNCFASISLGMIGADHVRWDAPRISILLDDKQGFEEKFQAMEQVNGETIVNAIKQHLKINMNQTSPKGKVGYASGLPYWKLAYRLRGPGDARAALNSSKLTGLFRPGIERSRPLKYQQPTKEPSHDRHAADTNAQRLAQPSPRARRHLTSMRYKRAYRCGA